MSRTAKILNVVFIAAFILFCAQCTSKVKDHIERQRFLNQEETVSIQYVKWQVTYVDPPKHFWVNIQNDKGEVLKGVARRKHCNRWRDVLVGSHYLFKTKYYKKPNSDLPNKVYVKILDGSDLCHSKYPVEESQDV